MRDITMRIYAWALEGCELPLLGNRHHLRTRERMFQAELGVGFCATEHIPSSTACAYDPDALVP